MKSFTLREYATYPNQIFLAAFMEGALPANIDNYTIDDVLNNCVIARPYYRSMYGTGGKLAFMPNNRQDTTQATARWPLYSAQQQVATPLGTKVIPKVILRKDFAQATFSNAFARYALGNRIMSILQHRFLQGESATDWLFTGNPYLRSLIDADDGKLVFAEYDFGTDVTLTSFVYQGSSTSNVGFNPAYASHQTRLQAYIENAWVDVSANISTIPAIGQLNGISINILYNGNASVTATRFRLKATNYVPIVTSQYSYGFAIHFYGNYVGTPRVVQDIGHVILMPCDQHSAIAFSANSLETYFTSNSSDSTQADILRDTVVGMSGYSVTSDPKQIANFDMFLPNDSKQFVQGTDFYPPFFVTDIPITEMVAL